jgi:hypothetical protein
MFLPIVSKRNSRVKTMREPKNHGILDKVLIIRLEKIIKVKKQKI